MKNKLEILEERIVSLNNILGDVDPQDLSSKISGTSKKADLKNVTDVITYLQREISENDSITFKDIYKKCTFNILFQLKSYLPY